MSDLTLSFTEYAKEVVKYRKKGIPTPPWNLIKSEEQIEGIRKAGVINKKILDTVAEVIKVGMTTDEINTIVHNKTMELGGIPAPLGYEGFPKSVCVSINEEVCHGIPSEKRVLLDGDIVNVDVTTIVDGFYADASRMFLIGEVSAAAKKLVEVTKEALDLCIKELKPYSRLGDIGGIIEPYCKKHGYTVVKEIGGHGVGNDFHEDPYVSHVSKSNTGMVLLPGMVFTIEPMVNEGTPYVYIDAENNWTIYTDDGKLSAQYEYTILVTKTGLEILTE